MLRFRQQSHPTWVRGLKLVLILSVRTTSKSHPTWVRGLKRERVSERIVCFWSHPTWVRGLKLNFETCVAGNKVAPYVGAWIETLRPYKDDHKLESHPTWVRGLKLSAFYVQIWRLGRTLRGCVD